MSWKGVSKAISRLPHQVLSRKSDATQDQDFIRLEKRFNEVVTRLDELRAQVQEFGDAVSQIANHQMTAAQVITELYDPMMGVQESSDGVVKRRQDYVSNEASQAVTDYNTAMAYCRDELQVELNNLEQKVSQPLHQVYEVIRKIRQTITKREHKLIDYDRFRLSYQKLKNKADRSPSEEKQAVKLQSQLDVATQDYEYLNDMLKRDLVRFFRLLVSLTQPIQHLFFNIQINVAAILYGRLYEVKRCQYSYFVTADMPIIQGFEHRTRHDSLRQQFEQIGLLQKDNGVYAAGLMSIQEKARARQSGYGSAASSLSSPPLSPQSPQSHQSPPMYPVGGTRKKPPPPPPPKPRFQKPAARYVVALYDLDAEQEGDLGLRKDERIMIIEKTDSTNDWWKGQSEDGRVGIFPANYVQEI